MEDRTIEIRWHGRGGQGAVTSAELLALAAIEEGQYAQAMPSFGPERRGAPVLAFNRINTSQPIRTRAPVNKPDIVVILDPGLLDIIDITSGLKKDGMIVVNSHKDIEELKSHFNGNWKLAVIDATKIAKELLGVPIVNTTMLGALNKAVHLIDLHSLEAPLKEKFGAKALHNLNACKKASEITEMSSTSMQKKNSGLILQTEKLLTWREVLPGAVITEAGNAKTYRTGDWRSASPVFDYAKCNKCGLCYIFCPEGCIKPINDGLFQADLYYCKGCGICAKECPRKVITMVEV